ncbi:MAG: PTS sugar transporter subunit IIC [Hungatella sp.]|jgi:PTS system cellobiose-specific IIC component|nr:PTS sugar transporter subunit IIC [Hungatella sp.]
MGASLQNSKFVDKFTEFAAKLGSQIHLSSLRDAFATIMPLYILAGVAVLFNNTIFQWFLSGPSLASAQYWGNLLVNATLNISSLLIATVIGYCLSRNRGYDNPIAASLVSLATLIIMMPGSITVVPDGAADGVVVSGVLSFNNIGTQAMFAGIIIGLAATELFIYISNIKKLQINMGDSIPPAVGKSFSVLIPFIIVMALFAVISAVLYNVFHTDLISIITVMIQEPLRGVTTGLFGCVLIYSLGNLLWLFGIHQTVLNGSLLEPLLMVNMTQCMAAYAAGEPIPDIINAAFVPTFGMMGGSGSTIALIIATLLFGRNKATKTICKLSVAPGCFNINEPIIFGYSIVYNITMIIPFVLLPAIGIIIGYAATALNFINECVVYIPWTTPPLLSGYLATSGDFRAVIVQIVIIAVGVLLYLPFVKINDKLMDQVSAQENE